MGCCASTGNGKFSPQSHKLQAPRSDSRADPPPSAEEETVKEVLSETPRPRPKLEDELEDEEQVKKNIPNPKPLPVLYPIIKLSKEEKTKIQKTAPFYHHTAEEEISEEVSEICSLRSESVSATTTLTRDDNDDDEVIGNGAANRVYRSPLKLPNKNRSFSGDLGRVGKSPTRRSNQSPGRRNGSGRMVQGRDHPAQNMNRRGLRTANTTEHPPPPHYQRRDYSGEGSAPRRSRSPATRSNMGRSPSAGRAGRSPGRGGAGHIDPRMEEGKWPPARTTTNNSTTTDESLDNPLVSLECFIFL
ncbi:uncharacterized protein LOC133799987 [Humulus lupulus]|uniref:uncharacterized protein LOC133799987 n=1 Tax=Humulus lupulus TaxID=3486 RepID=UPI002B415818|nr:uncharacterized protein LOC133799987 [Humulus lupulus]